MLRQRRLSDLVYLGLLIILSCLLLATPMRAAESPAKDLQLEVTINGQKTNLIAAFKQVPARGLYAPRSEHEELFIRAPNAGPADELVRLEDLDGVTYKLDEATQTIHITATDRQRLRRTYDAHTGPPRPQPAQADYGAVLNYSLFAQGGQQVRDWRHWSEQPSPTFGGSNVGLDARIVTPYGVLNSGFLVGANIAGETTTLRLDSYAVRVDPDTLKTYRIVLGGNPVGPKEERTIFATAIAAITLLFRTSSPDSRVPPRNCRFYKQSLKNLRC